MSFGIAFFGIISLMVFSVLILFVFFGQKTVRKLRKNPVTKDALGIELISGWDIIHVANALVWPKWLSRKARNSRFYPYFPDADLLKQHVTKFDIVLAKVFYVLWVASAFALFVFIFLDKIGVFE